MKAIAPKIEDRAADWYAKTFQSINAGTTFILNAFPTMYTQAMAEMRGKFTYGELGMILDVLNGYGTLLVNQGDSIVGQGILLSMHDSFDLYPGMYEDKWDATKDVLDKLKELTRFQKACMEIWAAGFWEQHENLDVTEYINAQARV
jgi:hypothetical protein